MTGELQELVSGHHVPGEMIHCVKGSGGITRASAQTGSDRNPFAQGKVNPEVITGCLQHSGRGSNRQVLVRWSDIAALDLDGDAAPVTSLGLHGIRQIDETEECLETVIPVFIPGKNPEEEVQLGQSRKRDSVRHRYGSLNVLKPPGVRARDQSPSNVIGISEVM